MGGGNKDKTRQGQRRVYNGSSFYDSEKAQGKKMKSPIWFLFVSSSSSSSFANKM